MKRQQTDPSHREPIERLLRPFLGTGCPGADLPRSRPMPSTSSNWWPTGTPVTALLYLAGTAAGALIAVWVTANATRGLTNWRML